MGLSGVQLPSGSQSLVAVLFTIPMSPLDESFLQDRRKTLELCCVGIQFLGGPDVGEVWFDLLSELDGELLTDPVGPEYMTAGVEVGRDSLC